MIERELTVDGHLRRAAITHDHILPLIQNKKVIGYVTLKEMKILANSDIPEGIFKPVGVCIFNSEGFLNQFNIKAIIIE
jgi:hypothetical protein